MLSIYRSKPGPLHSSREIDKGRPVSLSRSSSGIPIELVRLSFLIVRMEATGTFMCGVIGLQNLTVRRKTFIAELVPALNTCEIR